MTIGYLEKQKYLRPYQQAVEAMGVQDEKTGSMKMQRKLVHETGWTLQEIGRGCRTNDE